MIRKWKCTFAAAPVAALLLLFVMLPYTGIGFAFAQEHGTPLSPASLRSLATDASLNAKSSRELVDVIGIMFMTPAFNIKTPNDGTFTKKAGKFIQFLNRLAPAESAAAYKAAQAAVNASYHQARAFDALAKKLRQEADRLEREQQKKN